MAKHSEINHILNFNQNNIKYIKANNSLDYLFYDNQEIIFSDNNALPFNKIIAHNLNDYNNVDIDFIKKILFIHNPPDFTKKKEDIYIIKQKIQSINAELIFFDNYTRSMWGENNSRISPYSIPVDKVLNILQQHGVPIDNHEKTQNAIILNFNKNQNIIQLYDKIKQQNIDCDYIDNLPNSLESFIIKLMKYKVIINVEPINIHNSLFSILSGSLVICPNIPEHIINLKSLIRVSSFSEISKILQNISNLNNSDLNHDRDLIIKNHNNISPIEVI